MTTGTQAVTRDELQNDAIDTSPNKKPLSPHDLTTGLMYEMNIATARAALQAHEQAQATFLYHLRQQYGVPDGEWAIVNWAEGFVKKK
ncbi:MAG: hypothetical protein AB7L09_24550 [Nitrospira sp.]